MDEQKNQGINKRRIATIKSRIKYLCDIFTMKQAVYDPDPRIYSLSLLCIFTNVLF